ncbi:hypothetical protein [Rhodopirellula europaea]|uniref:hypothetical protein n=1 Tax=Rhodopirellula europaea TaxID=1263866 RepID=UPI003D2D539A
MSNHRQLIAALPLAITISCMVGCSTGHDKDEGREPFIQPGSVDAGYVPVSGKQVDFQIYNPTGSPLKLEQAKTSCGCTNIFLDGNVVRERSQLKGSLQLSGYNVAQNKTSSAQIFAANGQVLSVNTKYWTGELPCVNPFSPLIRPDAGRSSQRIWKVLLAIKGDGDGNLVAVKSDDFELSSSSSCVSGSEPSGASVLNFTLIGKKVFILEVFLDGSDSDFMGGKSKIVLTQNGRDFPFLVNLESFQGNSIVATPGTLLISESPMKVVVHSNMPGEASVGSIKGIECQVQQAVPNVAELSIRIIGSGLDYPILLPVEWRALDGSTLKTSVKLVRIDALVPHAAEH